MNDLLKHVERSIRNRSLFERGERIVVAVSGGVDSMVLLHLLHLLAPSFGWKLAVAHFNHRLRGRASDADEQFVRRSAKALGLKAVVQRGDVRAYARQHGLSIEMAARDLRHQFLARAAKRLRIHSIALAHHADDQVELFFLRLLRGSGGEGIAGMKWRSPSPALISSRPFMPSRGHPRGCGPQPPTQLVRPLLDLSKGELERFARENQIGYREDASNLSLDVRRNRIRHELLPLLKKKYQPALVKTVLRAMEIFGVEGEFVSMAAEEWLKRKRRTPFALLHPAVQRQCLRLQLKRMNIRPGFELIEQLRESADHSLSITPLLSISRDEAGRVRSHKHSPVAFNEKRIIIGLDRYGGEQCFNGVRCRWRTESFNGRTFPKSKVGLESFDADKVGTRIVLRHWQRGDRFRPIGMPEPFKLQDWFTNQKIPRNRRNQLLVAESASGEIFWVEGLRISENFKLTARTRKRLLWCWQRV